MMVVFIDLILKKAASRCSSQFLLVKENPNFSGINFKGKSQGRDQMNLPFDFCSSADKVENSLK